MAKKLPEPTDNSIFDLFGDLEAEQIEVSTPKPVVAQTQPTHPPALTYKQKQAAAQARNKTPKKTVPAIPEDQTVIVTKGNHQPAEIDAGPIQAPKNKPYVGPALLACGHSDWYTDAEHDRATAAGLCCPGGGLDGRPMAHQWYRSPNVVVPKMQRRTPEYMCGVCADPITGKYNGGGNGDCRLSIDSRGSITKNTDTTRWCLGHQPKKPE